MENNEGSTYKVPYTQILDIQTHPKADRLEVATVYGFQVIVSKHKYKVGDKIVYIPVDSILPENLESILFPADSKIKLNNSRVRQIRIRGLASQGMLVDPQDLPVLNFSAVPLETDMSVSMGITKYEPPAPKTQGIGGITGPRNRKNANPLFHQYNGLDNVKWFPDKFKEGDEVVIQEKLHGTNARASVLPFQANTMWKKIKQFLQLSPATEHCYGSNKVEISSKRSYNGFYGEDIYGYTFMGIDIFSKLKCGETVFGEIIGPKVQKNYDYGLNMIRFVLFDVKVLEKDGTQRWLSPKEVVEFAKERDLEHVPVLYVGPYSKELAYSLTKGNSVYCPTQKVREGIVIKRADNYSVEGNKEALKWVSEEYLDDQSNTDFH